jgi:hypothetical protein
LGRTETEGEVMSSFELLSRAKSRRAMAEHVKSVLWGLSLECDRDRLRTYADGLEHEAEELEAQAEIAASVSAARTSPLV